MAAIAPVPGAGGRHGLSDAEWTRLEPLLPGRAATGRPPKDHRPVIDALLWLARTGAPWRDLPERYGPWRSVATRFYRWTGAGLWERILAVLRQFADARGRIDWEVHMVDGTSVRAHRHAAGAKGGSIGRHWGAHAAGSAASCTCAATAAFGQWHLVDRWRAEPADRQTGPDEPRRREAQGSRPP